jgi:hypothetical protein
MKRRRPVARGVRARRRREIANVEKLVGTSGMRSLPWHAIYGRQIKDGTASPELLAAAEGQAGVGVGAGQRAD